MAQINAKNILDLLNQDHTIKIPIYQRNYDWQTDNCIQLINDINEYKSVVEKDEESSYYLGNIIYKNATDDTSGSRSIILVDGQQRITTSMLLLKVLQDISGKSVAKYLFNDDHDGKSPKMKLMRIKNKDILEKILKGRFDSISSEEKLTNYYKNYIAMKNHFTENKIDVPKFLSLLESTTISYVKLSKHENENKIFEAINSSGKMLTAGDLIKNKIFINSLDFTFEQDEELASLYINKIEPLFINADKLRNNKNESSSDDFFRYYVAIKGKMELPNKTTKDIYNAFKYFIKKMDIKLNNYDDVINLVNDIYTSALIFEKSFEKPLKEIKDTQDSKLKLFQMLLEKSDSTYYPMYFSMMSHWTYREEDKICFSDGAPTYFDIMKLIGRYSIYHAIANVNEKNITRDVVNYFNDYIMSLGEDKNSANLKDFKTYLENRDSDHQRIPTDDELKNMIATGGIYRFSASKAKFVLLAAEIGEDKSEPFTNFETPYSIEHIMPQNYKEHWIKYFGDEKKCENFAKNIDALPNLTLLTQKMNSELQNSDFNIKKPKIVKDSVLSLNKLLNNYTSYNEELLLKRTEKIHENITRLFSFDQDIKSKKYDNIITKTVEFVNPTLEKEKGI